MAKRALSRMDAQHAPAYGRALVRNDIATSEQKLGNFEEATRHFEEVARTLREVLGDEHPEVAGAMQNLASCLAEHGLSREAADVFVSALELYERTLGGGHPMTLNCASNAAHALQDSGDLAQAEALHRRVANGLAAALGETHPFVPLARAYLAENLALQGRLPEATSTIRLAADEEERLEGSWMALELAGIEAAIAGYGAPSADVERTLESSYQELQGRLGPYVRTVQQAHHRLERYRSRWPR
jgi:tetratricopeptide (TPR) repeat protein